MSIIQKIKEQRKYDKEIDAALGSIGVGDSGQSGGMLVVAIVLFILMIVLMIFG